MTEKSILEQALLQVQTLEEAVKQNAKGILASTMKQELNDLLKESMEDEEEVAEQPNPEEEETDDMSDEGADEEGAEDAEGEENLDNEMPAGLDSEEGEDLDSEEGEDDEYSSESEEDENPFEDEDDAMDMTGASDEEVMKVFKAMKPEDGIIVKKDGDSVHFSDGDNDYIIKLDDEMGEEIAEDDMSYDDDMSEDDMSYDDDMSEDDMMADDEVIYEIELDEEEEEIEEASHEEDMEEAARTKSNVHGNKGGQDRAGLDSKTKYKAGSGAINEDVEKLKRQNGEYKKALVLFKEKLNEVAVFNANLAYSTRLFTEHSTTKQEKLNILKRFDGINNMNESKALFNTIKNELETKNTITETVANKISNTPTTSSSKEMLAESKAYENPQFKRMKDLMSKIK
jgi:hypothetical protein